MANTRGASPGPNRSHLDGGIDLGREPDDWAEPEREPRDWKKVVLVIGLGTLSWVATYVGMLELIQANMGELPFTYKIVIGFSVAMLMIMIIWLLDQLFSPIHFATKLAYVGGYVFLTLISVGFGFGFYWKVLESRSEATRSAESAIGQVQNALHAGSTRMEQLNVTLTQLTELSAAKAIEEREKGTSCPNSSPGDGPRRKLRDDDAQRFAFASEFVSGRIGQVKQDLTSLDGELAKVSADDGSTVDQKTGTRNEFMRGLSRRLDLTVTGFNAFRTDPQLRQIRADLADRAEKTVFPTSRGGTFSCPDPQLQAALRGVVRAIDQLPELSRPEIAAVEGSEATIEAFRRLTASLTGAIVFDLPPSADELRELQKKAVQSVDSSGAPIATSAVQAGLSKRDYIPLAIAIFVDLCLLLVSMGRPMNRLNNLVPKMREAERGPVIRILSRFNEIHRDPEIRQNFEVFRHVVFDYHGAYYVAVPLDTPYNRVDPRSGRNAYYGASDAQDLQHEAHLLANLFSSFEREKIFARVHSPLLSTRMIQKRLARQGSKFAGSQAFRIYRFKDGAWSDIILGAVMGAARRVEEEKRRRRLMEERIAAAHDPVLTTPNAAPTQRAKAPSFRADFEESTRTGWADLSKGASGAALSATAACRTGQRRRREDALENEERSVAGDEHSLADSRHAQRGWYADRDYGASDLPYLDDDEASPDPQFQSQFGSYARAARAELKGGRRTSRGRREEADVEVEVAPANNNTAPSRHHDLAAGGEDMHARLGVRSKMNGVADNGSAPEAKVIPLPSALKAQAKALASAPEATAPVGPDGRSEPLNKTTVTMTRETATFTLTGADVPTSEAALPAGVLKLVNGADEPADSAPAQPADAVAALEAPAASFEASTDAEVVIMPPPLPAETVVRVVPADEGVPARDETAQTDERDVTAANEHNQAEADFYAAGDAWFDGRDAQFDALNIFPDEDEAATRSIAHRLKPASLS